MTECSILFETSFYVVECVYQKYFWSYLLKICCEFMETISISNIYKENSPYEIHLLTGFFIFRANSMLHFYYVFFNRMSGVRNQILHAMTGQFWTRLKFAMDFRHVQMERMKKTVQLIIILKLWLIGMVLYKMSIKNFGGEHFKQNLCYSRKNSMIQYWFIFWI